MSAGSPRLACTVRGCGLPLTPEERRWVCAADHSYDVARSGYINLLQPQDRRSLAAGDSREIVEARSRLFAAGIGSALVEAFVRRVAAMNPPAGSQAVELGTGTGDLLAATAAAVPITAVGIDLSAAAAEYAARRHPNLTWVVANADRRLPLPDASSALLLSMHARRNPAESWRVLQPEARLLVAVPAGDDLIELRQSIHGEAIERDRAAALIAEHAPLFVPVGRETVRGRHRLGGDLLRDLLTVTYRGRRARVAPRVEALDTLEVTLASELLVFEREPGVDQP